MTRDEAIQFYTVRKTRAKSEESKTAYSNIRHYIGRGNYLAITTLAAYSKNAKRRAIYKKALRELDI